MSVARFIQRDLDLGLITTVLATTVIGITMIYSATFDWDLGTAGTTYQKQILWAFIALAGMALTVVIPPKLYYAFAYIIYGVAILLLLLVLEVGDRRWFNFGAIHVQPSELAKIATVLAIARYLSSSNLDIERLKTFIPPALLVLLPAALVYKQPDLGTALVFGAVLFPMLYWAGLKPVNIFFIISPGLSLVCAFHHWSLGLLYLTMIAVVFHVRPRLSTMAVLGAVNLAVAIGAPYIWDNKLHDYQKDRILTFLNPDTDRLGGGYQVIQSKVAIGSGGLKGKGYLQGTQTKLAFLPEQHTDFVFSVVGEEFGFAGAITILMLFLFIVWRALTIATAVKSRFSSLVAIGLTAILVFHIFVNIGMTIGVMPVTGLPLPFLSYGGSPLVMSMVLVGFLLNVHGRRHEYY
ncbi:MAG: rod shape-determining protein RodA [Gemmatimonadetes bacterium]|nr:rod shape-determining protein RodA [Gemmatimonadota bacterium]|tara:strand:- start:11608 stop:12828 length:1221 start_codon:yes stop_codon:yes gene_type:complete